MAERPDTTLPALPERLPEKKNLHVIIIIIIIIHIFFNPLLCVQRFSRNMGTNVRNS